MRADRSERPAEGNMTARWSEPPTPGIQPGMADHAPNRTGGGGGGPGAKHQSFATSRTLGRGLQTDALSLRNTAAPEPEDHPTTDDALSPRFAGHSKTASHRSRISQPSVVSTTTFTPAQSVPQPDTPPPEGLHGPDRCPAPSRAPPHSGATDGKPHLPHSATEPLGSTRVRSPALLLRGADLVRKLGWQGEHHCW